MRRLAIAAASLTLLLAGCSLDLAPLSSFLTLDVKNDTGRTVTVVVPEQDVHDRVAAGAARGEAAWLNGHPGVALVRIVGGRRTLGCLQVHYREGQEHATVFVSRAKPCRR